MSIKGFEVGGVQQRYDYESLDNIPANLVQDANYVHTDNNYTNADKTKLSGIEAQANKTTIDATLTHSGQAADAKATGDAISALNAQVIASMPHDTASGSIASFPDGAAMPVIDCSVAVAPNQDLHGYDNPWPAGGGKNKCSLKTVTLGGAEPRTKRIEISPIPAGTYKISFVRNGTSTGSFGIQFFDAVSGGNIVGNMSSEQATVTFSATAVSVYVYFNNTDYTDGLTFIIDNLQVESGNSWTSFAPYSNICPISGWAEAKVTRTGKNLNPYEGVDFTASTHPDGFWLNAGDYVFSLDTGGSFGSGNSIYIKLKDRDGNVITEGNISGAGWAVNSTRQYYYGFGDTSTSAPFTLLTDCFFCFGFSNTKPTANGVQLELGSTATAYEAYQGQTYTIDLNGTRYGGTLDVTTGKLTVDMEMVDMGTLAWVKNANGTYSTFDSTSLASVIEKDTNSVNAICSCYSSTSYNDAATSQDNRLFIDGNGHVRVKETAQSELTETEYKTYITGQTLVYKLATPVEVTLTPTEITTLLGTNNIFADCGDTTVSYYADTTLFVNKKIAAAVAALS